MTVPPEKQRTPETPRTPATLPPAKRVAFWRGLTEHLGPRDDLSCGKATSESWLFHNGYLDFGSLFSVARWRKGEVRAQFALEGPSSATVYSLLLAHRDEIDGRFDSPPLWRSPEGSQTWLLETAREGDLGDESAWPELWTWLERELRTLQAACSPFVGRMPATGSAAPPAGGNRPAAGAGGGRPARRLWDEALFFSELERWNPEAAAPARDLLAAALTMMPDLAWGHGALIGSVSPGLRRAGVACRLVELRTNGTVALLLRKLEALPAFGGSAPRRDLLERLNAIPHVAYGDEALATTPALPLRLLAEPGALDAFVDVLRWFAATVRES